MFDVTLIFGCHGVAI